MSRFLHSENHCSTHQFSKHIMHMHLLLSSIWCDDMFSDLSLKKKLSLIYFRCLCCIRFTRLFTTLLSTISVRTRSNLVDANVPLFDTTTYHSLIIDSVIKKLYFTVGFSLIFQSLCSPPGTLHFFSLNLSPFNFIKSR